MTTRGRSGSRSTSAGVLLAAGLGERFAGPVPKLLAPFRGRPLVAWAIDAVVAAGFDEVMVVVGAVALDDLLPQGVTVVTNPDPRAGQATTIRCALDVADRAGHGAVVVGLGDQPLVPAEAWRRVGASDADIATATFGGTVRPPVRLARAVWPLLPVSGDEGARRLIRERPDLVAEIPCPGNPGDVDTVEDLERWS